MKTRILLLAALLHAAAGAQEPVHTYTFDADTEDSTGSTALIPNGGAIADGRYVFGAGQGLTLNDAVPDATRYTIEMRFRIDDLASAFWKKIVDFNDLAIDEGLYVQGDQVRYYPSPTISLTPLVSGQDATLILARHNDGNVDVYLDGVLQYSETTTSSEPAGNVLHFFRDDLQTLETEAAAGSVDYLRIFDGTLNAFLVNQLVAPAPAQNVVAADLFSPGDELLTYDPSTGYEWLDLTQTLGASIDDVQAGAGGWAELGFTVATRSEVTALYQSLGIRDVNYTTEYNAPGTVAHLALLGCTFSCGGANFQRATGLMLRDNFSNGHTGRVDYYPADDPATGLGDFPAFIQTDYTNPFAGVYLRRPGAGPDTDGDGIADGADNCTLVANADQRDSNGDGYGNVCDADLNNDGVVNAVDLGIMRSVFFTADADADLTGDGVVNAVDLGSLRAAFFAAPGPSGVAQ